VCLPGSVSGIEFQAELAKANIRLPIIFITGYGDIPMTVHAMKAGAVEFLTKPFRDQDLLDAVWVALDRDSARRDRERELAKLVLAYETLTARERQLFALVTSGLMHKQIAFKLGFAEGTVKVHRRNIMQKMGVGSTAALVRVADLLAAAHKPDEVPSPHALPRGGTGIVTGQTMIRKVARRCPFRAAFCPLLLQ